MRSLIALRIVPLCISVLLITGAHAGEIPERMSLTYSVEKSGLGSGRYDIEFVQQDGQLVTSSKGVLTGVAAAFANDETAEKVIYEIRENTLLPLRYVESRTGRKNYVRSANLDWKKHKISFSEAEDTRLPDGITVDAGSFPASLMWRPLPKLASATGHIVGGKKIRAYRYSEPVSETLETPSGTFDTLRIEKQRIDKENRKLVIWIAPKFGNLPLKIEERKGDKTTRFILESADGIDLE